MSEADHQQRLEYTRLAPAGVAPLRALEHYLNAESGLEPVLLELVRLRVSLVNGCAFCIGLHTRELRRHNEPDGRIAAVERWVESEAYTQRERAALQWADALTWIAGEVPPAQFRAAQEHFTDKELVDLSLAIASIHAWNRLGVAFLPQWDESRAGGRAVPPTLTVDPGPASTGPAKAGDLGTGGRAPEPGDDAGKVSHDEASS